MGAIGLEPKAESSQPLRDVNRKNQDHVSNVILLVVESFNKGRF
jgi:hypothetical protein